MAYSSFVILILLSSGSRIRHRAWAFHPSILSSPFPATRPPSNCIVACRRFLILFASATNEGVGREENASEEDATNEIATVQKHRWKHEPFDFSSRFGWDTFYKNGLDNTDDVDDGDKMKNIINDATAATSQELESLEYEWHGHIPHSVIVETIGPSIGAAHEYYSSYQKNRSDQNPEKLMAPPTSQSSRSRQTNSCSAKNPKMPSILVIGCGNSSLPRVLHDAFSFPVRVTCLDYSTVCIDMIQKMYQPSCPNMEFVVGDATKLKEALSKNDANNGNNNNDSNKEYHYDVIVDKGLLDALMCGEGFDSDLERLMKGIREVLTPQSWGMHVLICFQLSQSSKESLVEMGGKSCDDDSESLSKKELFDVGSAHKDLFWKFDIPVEGSERGRASFNLAKRCNDESIHALEKVSTNWK